MIAGRATFTLDGEEHDAPAGTLVHCPPDTLRSAFAAEPGTTVLGIGAKPGEVFQPSGWEWTFAAFALLKQGDLERARAEMEAGIAERPEAWQGHYNFACLEARARRQGRGAAPSGTSGRARAGRGGEAGLR